MPPRSSPKHRQVHDALVHEIQTGRWKGGDRLPSEAELVRRFQTSRITVGRAVRDLQVAGIVERRAGSGTYVTAAREASGFSFGLLIPDLGETDIFEPICQGMMASPLARAHALVWGSPNGAGSSKEERAWQLCRHYIDRRVSGVFFAPLELTAGSEGMNRRITGALDAARIPLVLLDRTALPYPRRGHHDLVGIDNRRAAYVVTEHLLGLGRRNIAFVGLPRAASTVDAREAGYREALFAAGVPADRAAAGRLDPGDERVVRDFMTSTRADAIVCANDRTAGQLMQTLQRLGHAIPEDVSLAGIDDVEYASLLSVPLTTMRQPTRAIGEAALCAMLERVKRADLPPRDILLHAELVVRTSCGAQARGGAPPPEDGRFGA